MMDEERKRTRGEALLNGFGWLLLMIGITGEVGLGGASIPLGLVFLGLVVFGGGMIVLCERLQGRRHRLLMENQEPASPSPLEGGNYRKAPIPHLDK